MHVFICIGPFILVSDNLCICPSHLPPLTCEDGPSLLEGGGCQAQPQQQGMSAQVVVEAEDIRCGGHRVWILLGLPVARLVLQNREPNRHGQSHTHIKLDLHRNSRQ